MDESPSDFCSGDLILHRTGFIGIYLQRISETSAAVFIRGRKMTLMISNISALR
jgi:hypothetical protein